MTDLGRKQGISTTPPYYSLPACSRTPRCRRESACRSSHSLLYPKPQDLHQLPPLSGEDWPAPSLGAEDSPAKSAAGPRQARSWIVPSYEHRQLYVPSYRQNMDEYRYIGEPQVTETASSSRAGNVVDDLHSCQSYLGEICQKCAFES